jgi:hypothetical protein
MLFAKTKHVTKKMTFTEFSENCRSNFSVQYSGKRDHEGNPMLDDPKVKQQLKLHKDALEKGRQTMNSNGTNASKGLHALYVTTVA